MQENCKSAPFGRKGRRARCGRRYLLGNALLGYFLASKLFNPPDKKKFAGFAKLIRSSPELTSYLRNLWGRYEKTLAKEIQNAGPANKAEAECVAKLLLAGVSSAVIVSGAGPVGLFLATEFALAKCSVLVLERAETPNSPLKRLPFGIRGLSASSIEALDRRDLLDELEVPKRLKDPHQKTPTGRGSSRQVGHFAGIPFYENLVDVGRWKNRLPSSTPPLLIAEMEELETVFARRAELLGVEIKRGYSVTGIEQSEQEVTLVSKGEVFKARYIV